MGSAGAGQSAHVPHELVHEVPDRLHILVWKLARDDHRESSNEDYEQQSNNVAAKHF